MEKQVKKARKQQENNIKEIKQETKSDSKNYTQQNIFRQAVNDHLATASCGK